ncbi:hypothetical protein AB4Z18_05060 [Leifsonia sp. 2TAF2]|uniref:hypothetical protein n=1 Tax=Leifsonia sp. 2TAF2 TaxID=3233009 RepID=UPI003F9B8EA3
MERIPDDGVDDVEVGESDAGETPGWSDPADGDVDYALNDPEAEANFADELVTNDAVAGETIWSGPGDGNDGPTGGQAREAEPEYDEHGGDDVDAGVLTEEDVEEEGI